MQPIYCLSCGKPNTPDAKFCNECAKPLFYTKPEVQPQNMTALLVDKDTFAYKLGGW
jgi:predicted amidophosphoribosyltransferase